MNKSFRNEGGLKSSAIAIGNDITESMFAKSFLCRLRKGPFEGPANAKPPALPEVMTSYFIERQKRSRQRRYWENLWKNPDNKPIWFDLESPRAPIVEAVSSGWIPPGSKILEIGCGRGLSADWLASQGFDVVGIDISSHAIDQATEMYCRKRDNLKFAVVDVTVPTELGPFDVMIDSGCFHCLQEKFHSYYGANVINWSQPGSRLLIMSHTEGMPPSERQRQLVNVLTPPFELLIALSAPHPERPKSSRWTFRFVRKS